MWEERLAVFVNHGMHLSNFFGIVRRERWTRTVEGRHDQMNGTMCRFEVAPTGQRAQAAETLYVVKMWTDMHDS